MRIIIVAFAGILLLICLYAAIVLHSAAAAQAGSVLAVIAIIGAFVLGPGKRDPEK